MSSYALRPCFLGLAAPASSSGLPLTSRPHRSSALPPALGRNNLKLVSHGIVRARQAAADDGHAVMNMINTKDPAEKAYEFREEQGKIDEYFRKMCNADVLHTGLSAAFRGYLCRVARVSVGLASIVMGKPGVISLDRHLTTFMTPRKREKMVLEVHVRNFVSTEKDAYNDKVTKETIDTFVGALEGVAAMSYFMALDTLANIGDDKATSLDCGPDSYLHRAKLEYMKKMDNLRHGFNTAPSCDADMILRNTVADAIRVSPEEGRQKFDGKPYIRFR